MKGKIVVISFVFLCLVEYSYPFWIWSPRQGKFKNPQAEQLAQPSILLQKAITLFDKGNYKSAIAYLKRIVNKYPDAKEAAQAQFYLAKSLQKLGKDELAAEAYHALITRYPNSPYLEEAAQEEYNLGVKLIPWANKKFLGIPVVYLNEHPSLKIFKRIADDLPNSKLAAKALLQAGQIMFDLKQFPEAEKFFSKIVDNYPESKVAEEAKFKLALTVAAESEKLKSYDIGDVAKAKKLLSQLSQSGNNFSKQASNKLIELEEKEAEKIYNIALFYEKQNKIKSAIIYYREITEKYPNTQKAILAQKKIASLLADSQEVGK